MKNVAKGWITSIIGILTMILTLYLVYNGTFDFIWEGVGGLVMGTILLLAPQTIEKKVSEAISKWSGGTNSSSSDIPNNEENAE